MPRAHEQCVEWRAYLERRPHALKPFQWKPGKCKRLVLGISISQHRIMMAMRPPPARFRRTAEISCNPVAQEGGSGTVPSCFAPGRYGWCTTALKLTTAPWKHLRQESEKTPGKGFINTERPGSAGVFRRLEKAFPGKKIRHSPGNVRWERFYAVYLARRPRPDPPKHGVRSRDSSGILYTETAY